MKLTFFDHIGTADMERIHSATIAWMISDSCEAFTLEERARFLKALFNVENADIKSIRACNEYDHIDIAFITKNSNNVEDEIWVIENKIKAPLGHDQLSKYNEIIAKFKYSKKHSLVLSLIGVLPQDDLGNWKHVTYSDLLQCLNQVCNKGEKRNRTHIIIEEYRDCLQNLVNALKEFEEHPENYSEVFTDGNKSKRYKEENNIIPKTSEKNGISIKDYISIYGLETLFQKYYFVGIINEISNRIKYLRCHVDETHGNADFAFHFGDMESGTDYRFDLSFKTEHSNLQSVMWIMRIVKIRGKAQKNGMNCKNGKRRLRMSKKIILNTGALMDLNPDAEFQYHIILTVITANGMS